MGYCRPFPKIPIQMADPVSAHPITCESACHPTMNNIFSQSKLVWCSKVCSSWNMLHVSRTSSHKVLTAALCHAEKQSHCHTHVSTTLPTIEQAPYKCTTSKQVKPWAVCYSKATSGSSRFNDGYGSTCGQDNGLNPNSDQTSSWLAQKVSKLETGAGARWCCFREVAQLPDWMNSDQKPDSYWCSGVAMRL